MLETYKIYALFYGFIFGSFATFVVKVSTTAPEDVSMIGILKASLTAGFLIGFVGWIFYFLVITSVSRGHGGTGGGSDSHSNNDDYGGGGDGGGD